MELLCPDCTASISTDNINISTDLAKCEKCNSIHKASELVDKKEIDQKEVLSMPDSLKSGLGRK